MRGGSSFISELVGGLTVHTGSDFNNRAQRSNNVVSVMRRGKTDAVEGEDGWGDRTQRKRLEKLEKTGIVFILLLLAQFMCFNALSTRGHNG